MALTDYIKAALSSPGKLGRELVNTLDNVSGPLVTTAFVLPVDYFMHKGVTGLDRWEKGTGLMGLLHSGYDRFIGISHDGNLIQWNHLMNDASLGFGLYSGLASGLVSGNPDSKKLLSGIGYASIPLAFSFLDAFKRYNFDSSGMATDWVKYGALYAVGFLGGLGLDYLSKTFNNALRRIRAPPRRRP